MMKSSIRIVLRKPQATRHVCPTSSRPLILTYECAAPARIVASRAHLWASKLIDDAMNDGAGGDAWQAPHNAALELTVYDGEGSPVVSHNYGWTLSCSQVCLIARYLSRFDGAVSLRKKREGYADLWDLLPWQSSVNLSEMQ